MFWHRTTWQSHRRLHLVPAAGLLGDFSQIVLCFCSTRPSHELVVMILFSIVPKLDPNDDRGWMCTWSVCCVAFFACRVKLDPCYIFGQGGFFLRTPVMTSLDSRVKKLSSGSSIYLSRIESSLCSRVLPSALLSFQRGTSLPQVPVRSASPSPSQEESLFFPDLLFSVTDAWNSSMKQFSFLIEILVLMCAVPGTQTLEFENFWLLSIEFLLSRPLQSRNIGMGTTTFDSFHDINLLRMRAFICCT